MPVHTGENGRMKRSTCIFLHYFTGKVVSQDDGSDWRHCPRGWKRSQTADKEF